MDKVIKKVLVGFALVVVVLVMGYFLFGNYVIEKIRYNQIDCDNIPRVHLKPSERHLAGTMAKRINGVALIPEENLFVSQTSILEKCPDFDPASYLAINKSVFKGIVQ